MSAGIWTRVGAFILLLASAAQVQSEPMWETIIDLATVQAAPLLAPANEGAATPFAKGSWTFQTYGAASFEDESKGRIDSWHVGFGYYLEDDLSINLEAMGAVVDATFDDDGVASGLDLVFRWHIWHRQDLTIYLDTAAGIQQATTEFPSDSHFNFRLIGGIGTMLRLDDSLFLLGGIRYLHISNAGITEKNNGLDAGMAYLGLMIPF